MVNSVTDRIEGLIAEVQSRISSPERTTGDLADRWPGAHALDGDYTIDPIELPAVIPDPSDTDLIEVVPLQHTDDQRDGPEAPPLIGSIVAFPEGVEGEEVLRANRPQSVPESIDALAFYLPFHFFLGNWGIYVRERGLLQLAAAVGDGAIRRNSRLPPNMLLDFAYELLWQHEFFHFKTEVACARLSHLPSKLKLAYPRYFDDHKAGLDEEGLANAFALSQAKRKQPTHQVRVARSCARQWMKALGPGYCAFPKFEHAGHAAGKDELVDRMAQEAFGQPLQMRGRLLYHDVGYNHVPTYLVGDGGGVVALVRRFTAWGPLHVWAYTNDHKPPHVHTGTGPGDPKSLRFEWPSRRDMDGAPARVSKQFNAYANRNAAEITKKVNKIVWQ